MSVHACTPKFPLGQLVATPGAMSALATEEMGQALARHVSGDWGNLDDHDRRMNDGALEHGGRILSAYVAKNGTPFWIITECDRSATAILLPEEY